MSADRLHVVFGAGQVGRALSARLADMGLTVRAVSRSRPSGLSEGIEWRAADASDPVAAADAAEGASVIYQCLNAPYTDWPERFPPLQRGVLSAAERNGALLVSLENLYGYGPTAGKAMTEDLPLAATTVKGRTRAAMTQELLAAAAAGRVRIAIGRASDFFGAGITTGTTLGERVFANAIAGKHADFIGNPDLPHTYSYVPDIAVGLATLGTEERAVGGVWHLPGPETVTTRQLFELLAGDVGHPVRVRNLPKLAVRVLGVFNPLLRELVEMSYEFDESFVLDTTKYESAFGNTGTPLATAITTTVDWYRTQNGSSTSAKRKT
jgi:nucleoside-diphosphate-sugar epimerase